jgi:hypothetical protein
MTTTTILDLMNDPDLLGKHFAGKSWQPWKAFLAGLFALPMSDELVKIYKKHTGRQVLPTEPFSEAFLVCGRRSGKSIIVSLVATFLAAFRDYSSVLGPGEVGVLMILASDRRQASVIFNYVKAFFDIPLLRTMVVNSFKESIELTNGVRIEIHTSSFRLVRGFTTIGVVADEVSYWDKMETGNPAKEVFNALRPSLASTNGLLLGLSSPYAKRGVLFEEYTEHFGKDDSSTLVWQAASREMNSTLSMIAVARAYARDWSSASAEYGGLFRSDVETFLAVEKIEAAVVKGRTELAYEPGRNYFAFVDPSGGVNDSMTLGISHSHGANDRAVLDLIREVKPPFSPEETVAAFAEVLKRYHISEVVGDRYSGMWVREQFSQRGILYKVSDRNRSEIYLEFLSAIMSGQVELLDNEVLKRQLASLERRSASLGKDSVDHGSGQNSHDDVANACAGALILAGSLSDSFGVTDFLVKLSKVGGVKAWFDGVRQKNQSGNARRFDPTSTPLACPTCGDRVIVQSSNTHASCSRGHWMATDTQLAVKPSNDADACDCGREELHGIVSDRWLCRQTGKRWGSPPPVVYAKRDGSFYRKAS